MNYRLPWILLLIAICALVLFGAGSVFRRYARLSREQAYLAFIGSLIASGLRGFFRAQAWNHLIVPSNEEMMIAGILSSGIVVVFLTAFVLRLWSCWIGDKATLEERLPGTAGVRAWFSGSNVFVGGMVVLTAWLGDGVSPLLGAAGVAALLAAQPLLRMQETAAQATTADDLSSEREKIVRMIETGKLTAEEGADLLQALGESLRTSGRRVPLSGNQRLMLIGAALVTVGFFLPWFVINPGKEAGRMMQGMNIMVQSSTGGDGGGMPVGFPFGEGGLKTPSVTLAGGDIQRGLGWATLLFALAAALMPYVATTLDAATAWTVRLLCLGIGGIMVLYLVTQNIRFVGAGLVIAAGGVCAGDRRSDARAQGGGGVACRSTATGLRRGWGSRGASPSKERALALFDSDSGL